MKAMKTKLPRLAREFLRTHSPPRYALVLRVFYDWMTDWKININDLRRAHIESFVRAPKGRGISLVTQHRYRRHLVKYLIWLHETEPLRFDPRCFRGIQKLPLPSTAAQYIRSLEPTRKSKTLNAHRAAVRQFHRWLDDNEVSLDDLKRRNTRSWLTHLSNSGNAPCTINQQLNFVRLYLRWCFYEQGILENFPDDLIRSSDMIKVPQYLPRPLPPATDKALQERLASSDDIYFLGLLLMRNTGLRIGEIISLKKDCIRRDHLGNHFLKVPLGKLNNERLVPLNDSTVALIDKLRESYERAASKTFLIETNKGNKTSAQHYNKALRKACEGLETNGKIVTHRLRHSYATTLLNAGMSLVGVMKLLGHTDHRMTLRYAEITQKTVIEEYFQALSRLEHCYSEILNGHTAQETDPVKMLSDVVHLIQKLSADDNAIKTVTRSIVKRIQRTQVDIQKLFLKTPTKS